MNISFFLRSVYIFFIISILVSSTTLLAQPYRAVPLTHPDGSFNAAAMNNYEQIAGTVYSDSTGFNAFRLEPDGQFTPFPDLGFGSFAYGMNELGEVLGLVLNTSFVWVPVVWEEDQMRELDLIDSINAIVPIDINLNGVAVGYIFDSTWTSRPIIWDASGAVQYLPDMDAVAGFPAAINDKGEIVGTLFNQDNWSRAALWQPDGDGYTVIDLGTLGGFFAQALDINNHSQIVGLASLVEGGIFSHAVLWDNLGIYDLGTIGGDNSRATGINDDSFIIGAAQDTASGVPALLPSVKWRNWQTNFKKISSVNKLYQPQTHSLSLKSPDDLAFWTRIRFDETMHLITPRLNTFTDNVDIDEELNDGFAPNGSRDLIGFSAGTGWHYVLRNFRFRYLDEEATEPGFPGRADKPYETPNSALNDENHNINRFNLFLKPGSSFGEINTAPDTKAFLNTYTGLGSTLQHGIDGTASIDNINSAFGSVLGIKSNGLNSLQTKKIELFGGLRSPENVDINISESFTLNGPGAFAKGHYVTGPTATMSLNQGYVHGMVLTNNPGYETNLVGRNNATIGDGVVFGGSRFSGITDKHCRHISMATGENGAYTFPVALRNGLKFTPAFVIRQEEPEEPVNVIIKAEDPDAEPKLNMNNINVGELILDQIKARYEVHAEPRNGNKNLTRQQTFTATIRVAVDSIDISDDPNRYRLLQFGFDGEYIGLAGTFVPHDGSSPTTAIYTGFIDSLLNVSTHNVTIIDSTILVLASGDIQTGLQSEAENNIIKTYDLNQNYPNPFNPITTIRYQIPQKSNVQLTIYNILGQPVRTLFEGEQNTGIYYQTWDTRNEVGYEVSSGVYIYRLEAKSDNGESFINTKKMTIIR